MNRWFFTAFLAFEILLITFGVKIHPLLPVIVAIAIAGGILLLKYPEITLTLFFMIGVIKGWLVQNISLFNSIDITLILTALIWGGVFLRYLENRVFLTGIRKKLYLYFFLFGILILLSGLYTPSPNYGTEKVISFWIFTNTLFLAPLLIIHTKRDRDLFLWTLMATIGLTASVMAFNLVHAFLSGQLFGYLVRLSVLGSNPIGVARILALGIGFTAVYIIRKDHKQLYLSILILLILIPTLFATGSRGPLVSLFLAALIYIAYLEKKNLSRIAKLSVFVILTVLIFIVILPESITKRFLDISNSDIVVTETGIERVSTVASRLHFWDMATSKWLGNKTHWLTGFGAGSFSNLFVWRDFRWYPHNIFVEILYELGLVGLGLFAFLCITFISNLSTLRQRSPVLDTEIILLILGMLILFFASFFSGDLNSNRLFWLLFAVSFASIDFKKEIRAV